MAEYASSAPFAAKQGFRSSQVGQVRGVHMPGSKKATGTLHTSTRSRVGKDAEGGEHKRLGRKGYGK